MHPNLSKFLQFSSQSDQSNSKLGQTPPNISKLLQTPSKLFQTLSALVQTPSKHVQRRPNVSKRVQTHLNAPNASKLVQILSGHIPIIQARNLFENFFKLLQTSPNSSKPVPNSSKPCPHLSKPCPNASKHVQMCQNVSKCIQPLLQLNSPNTSPSPTFILNHFPLLATFVHSLLDNFYFRIRYVIATQLYT